MKRTAALLVLLLTASAIGAPSARAQGDLGPLSVRRPAALQLEQIARDYYAASWKADPIGATRVGVHLYDATLGSYTVNDYAARVDRARKTIALIDRIPPGLFATDVDAQADREMFRARLEGQIFASGDDEARWRHDPSVYTSIASGAVFSLMQRNFAPLEDRLRSLIARERAIPAMFAAADANITSVDATTAAIAEKNIAGSVEFFSGVVPATFAGVTDSALRADLATANDAVVVAVRDFLSRMKAGPFAHPSGTFAIGKAAFERRLRLQELQPIALDRYERVGEAALAATKAEFLATARKIDPSQSPQAVAEALGRDHPKAEDLLPQAQRDLDQLRAFVIAKHIITLPPDNDVKVIPTPEFERQTSFASMDSPGALEMKATEAYYRITPVEPGWSAQRAEQHLSFFNNAYRPIISAHEVMPGHYVNFALAKHEKLSLIRKLNYSASFVEGWAHYDEQMMVDEGWGNGDPKVRLGQLQGALLRECRYLVGLREHTQGLSVDDATKFLMANAFLPEEPAHREALRGTQDPLYGYYTLGKLEILKLRADYRAKMGSAYTLQRFHDALLAHGSPPVAVLRKMLLGARDMGTLI